jgi:phosphate transport system permease protein
MEPAVPLTDKKSLSGDTIFKGIIMALAGSILLILLIMLLEMVQESLPAIQKIGWRFIIGREWDAVQGEFGALDFLYGSVVSSILAILLATPLSVGVALFITDIAPHRVGSIIAPVIELLAAIPSVIYGLWGVLVMAPWLQKSIQPWLSDHFGFLPFFQGAPYGVSMMAAVFILMIMIIPIITSITKEVLLAVPVSQKEAAYALGATRWEMVRMALIPYARSGVLGAVILGLGRATGAITMSGLNQKSGARMAFDGIFSRAAFRHYSGNWSGEKGTKGTYTAYDINQPYSTKLGNYSTASK